MKPPRYLPADQLALAARTRTAPEDERPQADIGWGGSIRDLEPTWLGLIKSATARNIDAATWFAQCALYAQEALQQTVEVDPKRRGGVPVIRGTRFTVAQALAELAESEGVKEVADRCTLNGEMLKNLLFGLAALAERPYK